jgi:hypothetical protein
MNTPGLKMVRARGITRAYKSTLPHRVSEDTPSLATHYGPVLNGTHRPAPGVLYLYGILYRVRMRGWPM